MTVEEAYKEIEHYFNLDLLPYSSEKLMRILSSLEKTKTIVKYKRIYADATESKEIEQRRVDLVEEAERIAYIYNTNLKELQSSCRQQNMVSARVHFCRYVRLHSDMSLKQIGKFLRKDHTSIVHYIYRSKTECMLAPLHSKYKFK